MSVVTLDIPVSASQREPAELARFREQWQAEVRQRSAVTPTASASASASASAITAERAISTPWSHTASSRITLSTPIPASHTIAGVSTTPLLASHGQSHLSPNLVHAVEVYRNAVFHEQKSQLDEALRLYRQAFRLDPNVDRAYSKEELLPQELSSALPAAHTKTSSTSTVDEDEDTRVVQKLNVHQDGKDETYVTSGLLAQVLKKFPEHLVFEPEVENEGRPPINLIPDELMLQILRTLDYTTVERFAAVSRKARVLSLDSAIWSPHRS